MKKILFVDDFDSIRRLVIQTLNSYGFSTLEAKNAKEGLNVLLASSNDIGLIISDFNMPEVNGLQFLEQVRLNKTTAHIPFFLLTTEKDPNKKRLAKNAGLSAWIQKPYQLKDFIDQIKNHLLA